MTQSLILDRMTKMSVRHNGLLIPGAAVETFLSQYCRNLAVWSEMEDYPIYTPGSATALRYRGRFFLVCTRHQLDGTANFEQVCLLRPLAPGKTSCMTSGGGRWFDDVAEGHHRQVVAFDFTAPCLEYPELQPLFFDFRGQHEDMLAEQTVAFISIGYPSEFFDYDIEEGRMNFQKHRVLGRFSTPGHDGAVHVIKTLQPIAFKADGMSGGPTFCINLDAQGDFEVNLAGITVRAGGSYVRVIKAGAVQAVLETAFPST